MRRLSYAVVVLVAALTLSTRGAWAQTPPATAADAQKPAAAPQRGAPPPVPVNQTVKDVQDTLDAVVLVQAQEALQLTNDQYATFFQRMKALQTLRQRHQAERLRLINQLNGLTKPGVQSDDTVLSERVRALDDLEIRMTQDEHTAMAAVDAILSPHQRARFRVFEENIEKRKLQLIAKVLNAGG